VARLTSELKIRRILKTSEQVKSSVQSDDDDDDGDDDSSF
jgi:hypothetical protein